MRFTQEDLDRTATEARAAAKAEATAEFAAAANDTAAELAALKAQAARDKHAASMEAWMREGRLLPAELGGMAEFMAALDAQATSINFSTGEGDAQTETAIAPAAWFANFMAKRPQLIKLGVREDAGDAGHAADYAGADGGATFVCPRVALSSASRGP